MAGISYGHPYSVNNSACPEGNNRQKQPGIKTWVSDTAVDYSCYFAAMKIYFVW